MGVENNLKNNTDEKTIEEAYQKYKKLKKIVNEWQEEKGANYIKTLNILDNPPFLPVKDMPLEVVATLWHKLNKFSNINVSDAKLKEIWEQVIIKKNNSNDEGEIEQELLLNLQIAITGVAELVSQRVKQENIISTNFGHKNNLYQDLVCPICGEIPTMTVLKAPNGNRVIHCLVCNYEWPAKRISCIVCGNTESKKQMYLKNEDFAGIEVVACEVCKQYFKEIDARQLIVDDYLWEDLRTLPLNFAVELWLKEQMDGKDEIH